MTSGSDCWRLQQIMAQYNGAMDEGMNPMVCVNIAAADSTQLTSRALPRLAPVIISSNRNSCGLIKFALSIFVIVISPQPSLPGTSLPTKDSFLCLCRGEQGTSTSGKPIKWGVPININMVIHR